MTEKLENKELASPEKLLIDDPSDFQFHAAYLTYSAVYDKTTDPEAKKQLNQNITALQQKQIDHQTFYKNINQYRTEYSSQHFHSRAYIQTQKKQEWRRETRKRERDSRHKK